MNRFTLGKWILFLNALFFLYTPEVIQAGILFDDQFDMDNDPIGPPWEIVTGNAWTENGWAYLHTDGPDTNCYTPWTRDSVIVTNVGASWSDYQLATRFIAEGGGTNWYRPMIFFRVQSMDCSGIGTYYRLDIKTPIYGYPGDGPKVHLSKRQPYADLLTVIPDAGVINNQDNLVEVSVDGGVIRVAINGTEIINYTDPDPILTGGIGLGTIWESTTRFDYVTVATPDAAEELECMGFEPPMDKGAVKVKKSRALPLKAELIDGNGSPVTDDSI